MHRLTRRTRSAAALFAAVAPLAFLRLTDFGPAAFAGEENGGGGAADPPAPPQPKKDKAAKEAADARYTDADLAERLKAERAKWDADAKARTDADKAKADEAAAREQGKWKELADKATAERDAARTEAARVRAENALHRHLAEKHPDYVGAAKWILPAVEFDATTTPETLAKRIEEAAAAYAKDNPRGPKPGAGAPPSPTGGRTAGGGKGKNGTEPEAVAGVASSRW